MCCFRLQWFVVNVMEQQTNTISSSEECPLRAVRHGELMTVTAKHTDLTMGQALAMNLRQLIYLPHNSQRC